MDLTNSNFNLEGEIYVPERNLNLQQRDLIFSACFIISTAVSNSDLIENLSTQPARLVDVDVKRDVSIEQLPLRERLLAKLARKRLRCRQRRRRGIDVGVVFLSATLLTPSRVAVGRRARDGGVAVNRLLRHRLPHLQK